MRDNNNSGSGSGDGNLSPRSPTVRTFGRISTTASPYVAAAQATQLQQVAVQAAAQMTPRATQMARVTQDRTVMSPGLRPSLSSAPSYNSGSMVHPSAVAASQRYIGATRQRVDSGVTSSGPAKPTDTNYEVPNADPDKPYVPPPVAHDMPAQYDLSQYEKPALVNALVTTAMSPIEDVNRLAPVVITKPTLIDRILKFFGLARNHVIQAQMAGEAANMASMSRTDAAYSLVRRARNGDQNAMAMIAAVRDQALAGNKQAEVSVRLMHSYIEKHPDDENSAPDGMGAESDNTTMGAAVELSHGPTLTDAHLHTLTSNLSAHEKGAFAHGMRGGELKPNQHPRIEASHKLGIAVGAARVIQASRMPHVPLSQVNSSVGWELGD